MKHIMLSEPISLGDKLAPKTPKALRFNFAVWVRNTLYFVLTFSLLMVASVLALWWFFTRPDLDPIAMMAILVSLIAMLFIVDRRWRVFRLPQKPRPLEAHSLLANDRHGFMSKLRLDAKTVIFDGSNLYHFGHDNGVDAQPLGMLAHQFRTEGYRIVCFFDANIFYTLSDHGAFPSHQHHSIAMLEDVFGLGADEIYVVPSGVQADKYILDSLKYLPVSFAVTNDQFRDYAKAYPSVMKGDQWRKSVVISENEVKLLQHRLQNPIWLN
ncbi:MAG: hypothetical protein ACI9KK_003187 [Ascidiaceihabitans sp.]|jgi:hypothetical protein